MEKFKGFTDGEAKMIKYVIQFLPEMTKYMTEKGEVEGPRQRMLDQIKELPIALSIVKKLDSDDDVYVVNLSTEEKALVLKFLNRPWGLQEAQTYLSLKEKLS